MRVDCSQLDPGAVIRRAPGEWYPRMPDRLDEEELADWRAGRSAVYQLAAMTVGARLAVADAWAGQMRRENPGRGRPRWCILKTRPPKFHRKERIYRSPVRVIPQRN